MKVVLLICPMKDGERSMRSSLLAPSCRDLFENMRGVSGLGPRTLPEKFSDVNLSSYKSDMAVDVDAILVVPFSDGTITPRMASFVEGYPGPTLVADAEGIHPSTVNEIIARGRTPIKTGGKYNLDTPIIKYDYQNLKTCLK